MIKFPTALACITQATTVIPKKTCYLGGQNMHTASPKINISMIVNYPDDFYVWYTQTIARGAVNFSILIRIWGALREVEVKIIKDITRELQVGYSVVSMELMYVGELDGLVYRDEIVCGDVISCDSELLCE